MPMASRAEAEASDEVGRKRSLGKETKGETRQQSLREDEGICVW